MIVPGSGFILFSGGAGPELACIHFIVLPIIGNTGGVSTDGGVTFSELSIPTLEIGYSWQSATHNESEFCILAFDGISYFYTAVSTDGSSWATGDPIESDGAVYPGVHYNAALGLYIAGGRSSINGIDWA